MDITQLEAQNFFGDASITLCPRCGVPVRVVGGGDPLARIARYGDQESVVRNTGGCLECVITGWLKSIEVISFGLEEKGIQALLYPHIQAQFTEIVNASMHEDFAPHQIKWQRIIDNWGLPMPKPKRPRKRSSHGK